KDARISRSMDRVTRTLRYGLLWPSRMQKFDRITTHQYARRVKKWITSIGLDPSVYATHSMRRSKATLIYKMTKNLRTVQLLLGHTNMSSTVRYLGVEVDDALEIAESIEIKLRNLCPWSPQTLPTPVDDQPR